MVVVTTTTARSQHTGVFPAITLVLSAAIIIATYAVVPHRVLPAFAVLVVGVPVMTLVLFLIGYLVPPLEPLVAHLVLMQVRVPLLAAMFITASCVTSPMNMLCWALGVLLVVTSVLRYLTETWRLQQAASRPGELA